MGTARQGTKNKTWRGVPIKEYHAAKATMTPEDFEKWVIKATGKPRIRNNVMGRNKFADMQRLFPEKEMTLASAKKVIDNLGKALLKEQAEHDKTKARLKQADRLLYEYSDALAKERNRSWISRLFNLKG